MIIAIFGNACDRSVEPSFQARAARDHLFLEVNDIGGAGLQERSQDALAAELGVLEMEGAIDRSRQRETCNDLLAKKLRKKSQEHTKRLDKDLDDDMHGGQKDGIKGKWARWSHTELTR